MIFRRKLDSKAEKWLRFEVEYANESDEKIKRSDKNSDSNDDLRPKEENSDCINLALYDQADPSNLYLATIDHKKFEKLMTKQNLVIEQFSQLAGHI